VKAEELRELDAEELSGRLKGARRELYELRFKMAVGQLDNPRQIGVVRKDIARILTIVHERALDEQVAQAYGSAEAIIEERPVRAAAEETPEQVEGTAADAGAEASTATATETEPETPAEVEAEAEAPAVEAAPEAEAAAESEPKPSGGTRKSSAQAGDGEEGDE
jgi:large subunit ribosomal protein L29